MHHKYRFSFGPWNISEGRDPFGPEVRKPRSFAQKLKLYKKLGFDGVQFHDDDAVPNIDRFRHAEIVRKARQMRRALDDHGLVAEFVAPRLWESPRTIDGAYTSNNAADRKYAIDRSLVAIDIANELGCRDIVLWLAREGTYIRESKDAKRAVGYLVEACNAMLAHDRNCRLLIEPKPNEPMDSAFLPTIGHAISISYLTHDPSRVGGLIESAHAILAGLDPSEEMAFALYHNKLWSVHLNDQNGLKFDEDKSFGAVDLRRAFNQVRVLDDNGYGANGEFVGLDIKAMRTQPFEIATKHLANSRVIFMMLLEKVRSFDRKKAAAAIAARDYEALELQVMKLLMGTK